MMASPRHRRSAAALFRTLPVGRASPRRASYRPGAKQATFPASAARYSRPFAAARPAHTGGEGNVLGVVAEIRREMTAGEPAEKFFSSQLDMPVSRWYYERGFIM